MSVATALAAIAALAATPIDSSCPNFDALGARYRTCVHAKAVRLERSGETADDVAVGAVVACREAGRATAAAWATCHNLSTDEMLVAIEQRMKDNAIAQVVEIRAARHSRN